MKKFLKDKKNVVIVLLSIALISSVATGVKNKLELNDAMNKNNIAISAGRNLLDIGKECTQALAIREEDLENLELEYNWVRAYNDSLQNKANAYSTMVGWAKNSSNGIQCSWYIKEGEDSIACSW